MLPGKTISEILVFFMALLLSQPIYAQVGEVNKNLEKLNETTTSNTEKSTEGAEVIGSDGLIFGFIFDIFANTLVAGQQAALANRHLYPERVSFITDLDAGPGFEHNTRKLGASFRGNWGILATDIKYNGLFDNTGALNTVDWQVLMIRFPFESVNLEYGIGFISVLGEEESFTSHAAGLEINLRPYGLSFNTHYYWTSISSLNTRFRKAYEIAGDYTFLNSNHLHLCGVIKYSFQEYFEETTFSIVSAGVALKFY